MVSVHGWVVPLLPDVIDVGCPHGMLFASPAALKGKVGGLAGACCIDLVWTYLLVSPSTGWLYIATHRLKMLYQRIQFRSEHVLLQAVSELYA